MLWSSVSLSLLSAALLYLSFEIPSLFALAFVAFIPLLSLERILEKRWQFVAVWMFAGVILYAALLPWLIPTSLLAYGLLILLSASFYGLFAAALHIYPRFALSLSSFWALLEYARSSFLLQYPWLPLASTQHDHQGLMQMVSVSGIYVFSALILYSNFVLWRWLKVRFFQATEYCLKAETLKCLALFLLVVGLSAWGRWRIGNDAPLESEQSLHVALVHSEISLEVKWDPQKIDWIVNHYREATYNAKREYPNLDLVVWPETAIPEYINHVRAVYDPVRQTAYDLNVFLLTGAPEFRDLADRTRQYFNSAFLFSPEAKIVGEYDKIGLVPFGEFTPLGIPWVRQIMEKYFAVEAEYTRGPAHTVFELEGLRFAAVICYETLFPGLFKKFVSQNIDFFIGLSNDNWFGPGQVVQRLRMSKFRAVEFAVPILLCTNKGLTSVIDRFGRVRRSIDQPGFLACKVLKREQKPTFYTRFGFLWICLLTALAMAPILGQARRRFYG